MALPFLMASLRSASEEERADEIASKASEAGNCSVGGMRWLAWNGRNKRMRCSYVPFLRDMLGDDVVTVTAVFVDVVVSEF